MMATAAILVRAAGLPLAIWRPRSLWVRSLAGSFSLVCNFFALARLPVADAVTLSNVHPLWIVLITAAALRRWPAWSEALGVVSGLAGVILIERPDIGNAQGVAVLVALMSSVSTSVAMLGLHRLRGIDTRAVVAHFAGVASAVAAIWLILRWDQLHPTAIDPVTIAMLLGVGAAGTLGQILPDQGLFRRRAEQGGRRRPDAGGLRDGVRRGGLGPVALALDAARLRPRPGADDLAEHPLVPPRPRPHRHQAGEPVDPPEPGFVSDPSPEIAIGARVRPIRARWGLVGRDRRALSWSFPSGVGRWAGRARPVTVRLHRQHDERAP